MDYQRVLSTVYFRPGENPVSVLEISIIDDGLKEDNEVFALELTSFDLPVVLVNSVLKVVLNDNDDGNYCSCQNSQILCLFNSLHRVS